MKTLTGTVTSVAMKNTVVVERTIQRAHPLYKKIMRRNRSVKAHVDDLVLSVGDTVMLEETKPYSKDTHYKVVKKVE